MKFKNKFERVAGADWTRFDSNSASPRERPHLTSKLTTRKHKHTQITSRGRIKSRRYGANALAEVSKAEEERDIDQK